VKVHELSPVKKLLLDGAPAERNLVGWEYEGGDFKCGNNQLTSLKGAPTIVKGDFYCSKNKLTSLKGAPKEVGGYFHADGNNLTSLEGAPTVVGGYFSVSNNPLTSLKDVHKHIKEIRDIFYCRCPIRSHVLGLMKIKGLKEVRFDNAVIQYILNRFLPGGSVLDAQSALLDAGLDEWAQL
jgi:hypothetical protein